MFETFSWESTFLRLDGQHQGRLGRGFSVIWLGLDRLTGDELATVSMLVS